MQAAGSVWMGYKAIEVLFLISGGLTVAYMAKLYICISGRSTRLVRQNSTA